MSGPSAKTKKTLRGFFWIFLIVCMGFGLENFPGSYVIEDFQDEFELTSPEGIALLALEEVSLQAEMFFKEAARHRISRNAEIRVPAGATLNVSAKMVPYIIDNEVVTRPNNLLITSNQPLTFIYRFVPIAKTKTLKVDPDSPDQKVKVVGQYKILTAIMNIHRYQRQKAVKRDYKIPEHAKLDFKAETRPNHEIKTHDGYSVFTGAEPGVLSIENALWKSGRWESGRLSLSLTFADLDPLIDQLMKTFLREPLELGSVFHLNLNRIYDLQFSNNFLTLQVDGTLSPSNSKRMANMFHPSFTSDLGIAFSFPENVPVHKAKAGIGLDKIYSMDFNRNNPLFDKTIRNIARKYKEDANQTWDLGKEFPILLDLPGTFIIETMELDGNENGYPALKAEFKITPDEERVSN